MLAAPGMESAATVSQARKKPAAPRPGLARIQSSKPWRQDWIDSMSMTPEPMAASIAAMATAAISAGTALEDLCFTVAVLIVTTTPRRGTWWFRASLMVGRAVSSGPRTMRARTRPGV